MIYDAIVIGGGPGGYVAAIRLAQLGGKVAVVEKDSLGGTCLNRGCIPTKALIATIDKLTAVLDSGDFGIEVGKPTINFERAQARKAEVVEKLVSGIHFLFQKHKIDLIEGTARLKAPNLVEVTTTTNSESLEFSCKNIVVATRSSSALIKALGYNGKTVITSEEALALSEVPKSLLIIGAGVIGCEFAHIYSSLGAQITMVEATPSILPLLDKDLSRRLQMNFKKKNIRIKTRARIQEIVQIEGGIEARLENGEKIIAEKALISIGRVLTTDNLGLEEVGVSLGDKREIIVNERMKTNVEGIYAIGDVVNKYHKSTAKELAETIHAHPTLAEAIMEAAENVGN